MLFGFDEFFDWVNSVNVKIEGFVWFDCFYFMY